MVPVDKFTVLPITCPHKKSHLNGMGWCRWRRRRGERVARRSNVKPLNAHGMIDGGNDCLHGAETSPHGRRNRFGNFFFVFFVFFYFFFFLLLWLWTPYISPPKDVRFVYSLLSFLTNYARRKKNTKNNKIK